MIRRSSKNETTLILHSCVHNKTGLSILEKVSGESDRSNGGTLYWNWDEFLKGVLNPFSTIFFEPRVVLESFPGVSENFETDPNFVALNGA
ncbi:hypothetical protein AYI69_g1132 [Smittium culicis]|uniref:Uncharacterized protein n=1 Tax=Smittium culicis TaxID=133412 RepID=A0A1R1YR85_9FUNG|nr:hypothetical protein AYI69_g1132 [Smittium culicis]